MTRDQIHLIQRSFAQLAPDVDLVADLLCARLFQLDPSLRGMLPNDLRQKKRDVIYLLTRVLRELDQPNRWTCTVCDFGKQLAAHGVGPRHYETFGTALLWTLEKGIGEQFTFDVLEAWVAFYGVLTRTLQQANCTPLDSIPLPLSVRPARVLAEYL